MKQLNPKYEFKSYEGLQHAVNDQVNISTLFIKNDCFGKKLK